MWLNEVQLQRRRQQLLVARPGQQLMGEADEAPAGVPALAGQAPVLPQPVLLPGSLPPLLLLLCCPGLWVPPLPLPPDDPPPLLSPPSPLLLLVVVVVVVVLEGRRTVPEEVEVSPAGEAEGPVRQLKTQSHKHTTRNKIRQSRGNTQACKTKHYC